MWVDDHYWIYWTEQCEYCAKRTGCEYHGCMKEYIYRLQQVKVNPPVYGSLNFTCDYFHFDKTKYKAKEICESNG